MRFRTLDDLEVRGKCVLVRADLNVPMKDGAVTDIVRLERQAPTIRELAEKGARVIVLSHFDRPKGVVVPSMSLAPIAGPLSRVVGRPVAFASDCVGSVARTAIAKLGDGEILLLENTRFHAGEEQNDHAFAQALAALGEIYVNDAFSVAHRAHASTEAIAHMLPSAVGRSMQSEIDHLHKALDHPNRPVTAVVGGAKSSTKTALLENILPRVNTLFIAGAMANTFMAARGLQVGKSLFEPDLFDAARHLFAIANNKHVRVLLPLDVVVAKKFAPGAPCRVVAAGACEPDEMILDVGPGTIEELKKILGNTATVVWNGPLGAFETPPFDAGTVAAARAVAAATKAGTLLSVAGGGDTVAALNHAGVFDDFSYVSTAGGAFLEWLEGQELPGVAALMVHGT